MHGYENMGMTGQQGPAQTSPQQITTGTSHIQTLMMNQYRIPVYQPDTSAIQALITQSTSVVGGSERGGAQKYKKYDGRSDFKVSEGEKYRMRKMCGLEDTVGDECFPK